MYEIRRWRRKNKRTRRNRKRKKKKIPRRQRRIEKRRFNTFHRMIYGVCVQQPCDSSAEFTGTDNFD